MTWPDETTAADAHQASAYRGAGRPAWRTEGLFRALARAQTEWHRQQLRDQIVLDHQYLAARVVARYRQRGQDVDDLTQVAAVGLVRAVRRFRLDFGSPFPAFAVLTMSGEIKHYYRDTTWMVRPPRRLQELLSHVRATEAGLTHQLHRVPTCEEVSSALGITETELREVRKAASCRAVDSLDRSWTHWGERLRDGRDDIGRAEVVLLLQPELDRLDDRARALLRLRFIEEATQAQIATVLGISQMHVSRLLRQRLHETLAEEACETCPAG